MVADFAKGLSDYFTSPGILAAVRRRFESASRRPGMDPATFATELGILAMRGFENMGECARDLMVRNKFIAAQQSYALRRHLDDVSVDASIGEISQFHNFPSDGGTPATGGIDTIAHVTGEHGTVIADARVVTSEGDL